MTRFVEFKPQDIVLPTYVRFSVTKGAFEKMLNHPSGVKPILMSLSASSVLLITKGRSEGLYEVFTSNGSYLCRITDDFNSLLIIGFNENTLIKQNNAMKNGICFRVSDGIIVQLTLAEPYNYFFDIVNGKQLRSNSYSNRKVVSSARIIKEQVDLSNTITEEDGEILDEEYEPERRLSNLLQISEHYSILSSELEERNANAMGRISYYKIEAIEYDRVDRVAYRFLVDSVDEKIFKVGVRLELEDKTGESHSGEIIHIEINDDFQSIDLLFNEQIGVDEFSPIGWISLSFSTVNKEVQLTANERIRSGEAPAKYMDNIIGKRSSAGFENKDLTQVEKSLMESEYPPNESQMKAIAAGINTKDVFLVMGPPGTGKTTVILEWVKYFVRNERKRVLISSQNNKAVDNVLSRIIDEKDIDIIRIGSEAKLQSEVRPYMFENKIKDLRESIVENTGGNIKKIKDTILPWLGFLDRLKLLIQTNKEVDKLRNDYENIINNEIITRYNELVKLYEDYHDLRDQIILMEDKLSMKIEKINDYENRTKIFDKIIFALPNFIRNMTTRSNVAKFDKLKARESETVNRYNGIYLSYTSIYEKTLEEEFTTYYHRDKLRNSELVDIEKTLPHSENKWGLFSDVDIKGEDWKNTRKLINSQAKIEEENHRGQMIIETIGSWKLEIESSQNYALNEIILESVDLVGATCIGINSQRRFANLDFDITIIDEAGQIQVHNGLVPMSVSNKLIMLGDHKQIPPTADQELLDLCEENGVDTDLLEMSLFEKMYDEIPETNKIMLDTQYRMPGEIADTISEWFYEGQYLSADFKRNGRSQIPKLSEKPFLVIDTSGEPHRYEKRIPQAGSNNNLEGDIIRDLVSHISLDPDANLDEIGVISAYKSQVKLVKEKLGEIFSYELINEMVATLDSYQGQERDIIIYSFTKSSSRNPKHRRIGFLNELRRLNVAMTRCKKMLILIGDMEFLSSCEHMDIDEDEEIVYEKSEKEFSDFINKMLEDVKAGRGEIINYKEFIKRLDKGSV